MIAAYGDKANTTMLVATFPLGDKQLAEEIKTILTGARAIEVKRRPLGENVDFKVGETRKLRIASDTNNTLVYSPGGVQAQQSPTDPMFVASKSGDVFRPATFAANWSRACSTWPGPRLLITTRSRMLISVPIAGHAK